jgi:hypothetical protein
MSRRMKNWSRVPDGRLTPRWTGRLIVGRNVTLTEKEPRVEVGYNTSTVVPASCKRRQKGNTVSDEMVEYGYWVLIT